MYQDDNLETIYNELAPLETEIQQTGENIRQLARDAANAAADYENAKNLFLIELYKEEAKDGTKRTEAHRTALYRSQHAGLRLASNLKKNEHMAERDYLDALKSKLMSIQSRAGILKIENSFNGRQA